jgi:hypothetical protein
MAGSEPERLPIRCAPLPWRESVIHLEETCVVNLQFDRRESGESPELPFTVSAIEVP